ncbi:MAG: hypothetical protein IPG50_36070 [Myxococcales bacterium]|nr:hypothetical protein [Myxococcales bacterium]
MRKALLLSLGLVAVPALACSGSGFSGNALPAGPDDDASVSTEPTGDGGAGTGDASTLTCKGARADCNKRANDGCEVDTSSNPKHCGACGKTCSGGQVCASGKCSASCPTGLDNCGGACVDVQASAEHCGGCGKACATSANATAVCSAAKCGLECIAGFTPCAAGCCSGPTPPPLQTGPTLSAGGNHTCAVTASAGLKCWGSNGSGKLGDNTLTDRKAAVQVSGLTANVVAVGAGNIHTCALLSTGEARCWGGNGEGQLGTGDNLGSKIPQTVSTLGTGALALAVGRDHSCAIATGGVVKCWGVNDHGQLGDGTTNSSSAPLTVSLPRAAVAIACGSSHSCALLDDASISCWGANDAGQLGDASVDERLTPVVVAGAPAGILTITAGISHTCSRTTSSIHCWGDNASGQLGDATTTSRLAPTEVPGLVGATQVEAGTYHTCAVDGASGVECWGLGSSGQLGDGVAASSSEPVKVSLAGLPISEVAAGSSHTCARVAAGPVRCWGSNSRGQLGNNSLTGSASPVSVFGM